jgi:hypothetical protein
MRTNKILDLWLPLALLTASSIVLRVQVEQTVLSFTQGLLPLLTVCVCYAGIVGLVSGLIAGLYHRSLTASALMAGKVATGAFVFALAGAALGTLGNSTAAEVAKSGGCGEGLGDALKMMAGWLGGAIIGLWWGIARGGVVCQRWQKRSSLE